MRRLLWALLLLVGLCQTAQAVCTLTPPSTASFGTRTSFVINSTVLDTSATFTLDCTAVLTLLTNDFIRLTYVSSTNPVGTRGTLRNTANTDSIPFVVCSQANCAAPGEIATAGSYTWSGNQLLGLLSGKRYALPFYFRTVAGQNISAGTYQATLNFRLDYSICETGIAVCLSAQTGSPTFSMTLNVIVTNDCSTINAPAVSFGSAPLVQNFAAVTQNIVITCTKGSAYTVGLNNGLYANGNVRNMASTTTPANRLSYEVYKGNTNTRWGISGTERWASTASSSISTDQLSRTYNYTARVLPTQTTPPGGTYTDTLVVDVAF